MNPTPSSLSALIEKQSGEELGDMLERVIAGVATSEESDAVWTLRKNLPTLLALSRWSIEAQDALNQIDTWAYGQQDKTLLKITRKPLLSFPLPHAQ